VNIVAALSVMSLALLAAACASETGSLPAVGRTRTTADAEPTPSATHWQPVFVDLPGALTSVWGASEKDVWLAGSDANDGFGPLVLHLEAGRWLRKKTGATGDLWWVHGFAGGQVFFGGSEGTVIRFDRGRFERIAAPRTHGTVYGVWGADSGEVWAVGGDTLYGTGAFVWKYTGARFENVADLPVPAADVIAYFKVWGTSKSDVWVVGTPGISLHYDGTTFERVDPGVPDPLFTVHASPSGTSIAAVGGADLGVLIERQSTNWASAVLPADTRLLAGICLTNDGGYAVGAEGTVLIKAKDKWIREATGFSTTKALHSVWVDRTGDVWTVGGDVLFPPYGGGLLLHRGATLPTSFSIDDHVEDAGDASPDARDGSRDALPDRGLAESSVEAGEGEPAPKEAGPRDAAPDTADAEGGDSAPRPHVVRCGSATCSLSTERCCANATTGVPAGCVGLADPCPTGEAPVSCDEPSDCGSGRSCCLNRYQQAGDLQNVQCQPSCVGPAVCQSDRDCGAGTCTTFSIMKSYMICLPP
jgi:hypothetical protein